MKLLIKLIYCYIAFIGIVAIFNPKKISMDLLTPLMIVVLPFVFYDDKKEKESKK